MQVLCSFTVLMYQIIKPCNSVNKCLSKCNADSLWWY